MKKQVYTYQTGYGERTVEAATMFDINTAIMRCLVKNIALFGFAINIVATEILVIAVPFCINLTSTSFPKFPINIALLTLKGR
jgi:hypothetical protein